MTTIANDSYAARKLAERYGVVEGVGDLRDDGSAWDFCVSNEGGDFIVSVVRDDVTGKLEAMVS